MSRIILMAVVALFTTPDLLSAERPTSMARRLFDNPSLERVRLAKMSVQDVGARTSLRFRVEQ